MKQFYSNLGLQEEALNQIPSDIELQRFSSRCEETVIRELAIHLGMTLHEWEKLRSDYEFVDIVKYRVLVSWREKYSGRFINIAKALQDMDLTTHTLCQVNYYNILHLSNYVMSNNTIRITNFCYKEYGFLFDVFFVFIQHFNTFWVFVYGLVTCIKCLA